MKIVSLKNCFPQPFFVFFLEDFHENPTATRLLDPPPVYLEPQSKLEVGKAQTFCICCSSNSKVFLLLLALSANSIIIAMIIIHTTNPPAEKEKWLGKR